MNNQKKYLYILLWGTGMYTLQNFISNPNNRAQIIISIAIAYLIYTANQVIMTDIFYSNKYLRHSIPMLTMNCVLIPINILIFRINHKIITVQNVFGYIFFNVVVLIIYILQHLYHKKNINRQLTRRINLLD